MNQAMSLSFGGVQFDVVDRDGQPWLKGGQLAQALEYKNARAITNIYERNKDEFSDKMSVVLNLSTTKGVPNSCRIFSLRGAHLIAMFARTKVAKDFRKWVLDVLDQTTGQIDHESQSTPSRPALPEVEFSSHAPDDLDLALRWFRESARQMDAALDKTVVALRRHIDRAYMTDHPHRTVLINLGYSLDEMAQTTAHSISATKTISRTIQRTIR